MEGTIERESGALGGLFQQIIQDMKVGQIKIYVLVFIVIGRLFCHFQLISLWFNRNGYEFEFDSLCIVILSSTEKEQGWKWNET